MLDGILRQAKAPAVFQHPGARPSTLEVPDVSSVPACFQDVPQLWRRVPGKAKPLRFESLLHRGVHGGRLSATPQRCGKSELQRCGLADLRSLWRTVSLVQQKSKVLWASLLNRRNYQAPSRIEGKASFNKIENATCILELQTNISLPRQVCTYPDLRLPFLQMRFLGKSQPDSLFRLQMAYQRMQSLWQWVQMSFPKSHCYLLSQMPESIYLRKAVRRKVSPLARGQNFSTYVEAQFGRVRRMARDCFSEGWLYLPDVWGGWGQVGGTPHQEGVNSQTLNVRQLERRNSVLALPSEYSRQRGKLRKTFLENNSSKGSAFASVLAGNNRLSDAQVDWLRTWSAVPGVTVLVIRPETWDEQRALL